MRSTLLAAAFLIAVGGLLAQAPDPKAPQPDPKAQPPVDPKAPAPQPPVDPKAQPPVPAPAATASDFFPIKKGTKWTYKYAESDVVMEVKESAAEVKVDTLSNGKVVASETLKLMADAQGGGGIYRTKINNLDITPPLKILDMETKAGKLVPKAKGTKWAVDVKVQQATLKGDYTIGETVKLKLPAPLGDTDAVPVVAELNIGGTATTVKYWFATGKGQVKVSYTIANNEQAMELKTFEDGK